MKPTRQARRDSRAALCGIVVIAAVACCLALSGPAAGRGQDVQDIQRLIAAYAESIDRADSALAKQVWSDAPEVSFIHPLGEERGFAQVEQNFYGRLMGGKFSERRLTVKDVSIHVYGDAAWSEFDWDFMAKARSDGAQVHTQGRETQVYRKEHGRWRLVHVHYSGVPVAGGLRGF
jgi:ketosteroid isomerase-like protein